MNDEIDDAHNMSLDDLVAKCGEETSHFYSSRSSGSKNNDPRYCLELFRRAIVKHDSGAWDAIYNQYQPQVERWVYAHGLFRMMSEYEEAQDFVAQAFERFWKWYTVDKFAKSSSLGEVLNALKVCVDGVLRDSWRKLSRRKFEHQTEDELQDTPEPELTPEELIQIKEIWNLIKDLSKDDQEYTVVFASLNLDLPPREILAEYPELFNDIKEIYQHKANALARFENNPEIGDYFQHK